MNKIALVSIVLWNRLGRGGYAVGVGFDAAAVGGGTALVASGRVWGTPILALGVASLIVDGVFAARGFRSTAIVHQSPAAWELDQRVTIRHARGEVELTSSDFADPLVKLPGLHVAHVLAERRQ